MSTFGANNNSSARTAFEQKVKFNTEAYADVDNQKGIVEFNFFEKIRYGHVNTKGVPIIPREEYMQPIIYSSEFAGVILDCCVYGVEQILKHFLDCIRFGIIEEDQITEIAPIQAYTPPILEYRNGIVSNLDAFNKHIVDMNLLTNISDFDQYVKKFLDYFKINYKQMRPMTLAKHCLSRFASPLETGLAVKFFPTVFDVDQVKYDTLISSPNFQKYVDACRNFGFSVVKHTPNMVIFDINSAANVIPLQENEISSIENLFETRYTNSMEPSISTLRAQMVKGYNRFVDIKQVTLVPRHCREGLVYRKHVLPKFDINNIDNNNYINNNINNIYITFRYYEEQERMSIGKFNQIKNNVKFFQKRFDNDSVLGYINDEFQNLYKDEENSYNDFIRREKQKEIQKLEDETQAQLTATTVEIEEPIIQTSQPQATDRGTY